MSQPTTPYGETHQVTLTGWERRQIAMWAEAALLNMAQQGQILRKDLGALFPKLEGERRAEWTASLLKKFLPEESPPKAV